MTTKPRRKRCTVHDDLVDADYGARIDGRFVCVDCLPKVAEAAAAPPEQAVPAGPAQSLLDEAASQGLPLQQGEPDSTGGTWVDTVYGMKYMNADGVELPPPPTHGGSYSEAIAAKFTDAPPTGVLTAETEADVERIRAEHGDEAAAVAGTDLMVRSALAALPAPTADPSLPVPSLRSKDESIDRWRNVPEVHVTGWPLRRGRLTASALGTFARCPEQFRKSYVKGEAVYQDNGKSLAGTAMHAAVDVAMRFKMQHGTDMPVTEAIDVVLDAFKQAEDDSRGIEWGGDPGTFKDWAVRTTQAWVEQVSPMMHPVATEQPFAVTVPGVPVPVVGAIDLVTDRAMVDYKNGKAQTKLAPDWRVQGLTYLRATDKDMHWHAVGWPLKDGTVNIHTPADVGGALVLPNTAGNYKLAGDLIENYLQGILAYAERFGLDDPWPGNVTHTWACGSCDFGPVKGDNSCRWWQDRPDVEALLL